MRWAFSKAFWLIGWVLNFAMFGNLFFAWQAGATGERLVLIFFAYFIPLMLLLNWAGRLQEPRQTQRKARPTLLPAAIVQPLPQAMPEPPPRPQERRIAMPPVVGVPNAQLAAVRASMPDRLRRFVIEGEHAITEPPD